MNDPTELPKDVLILCYACFSLFEDEEDERKKYFYAKFGPQGLDFDDVAVLIAPQLHHADPYKIITAKKLSCDHCGFSVYVAPSSQWLLDIRAALEQRGR